MTFGHAGGIAIGATLTVARRRSVYDVDNSSVSLAADSSPYTGEPLN